MKKLIVVSALTASSFAMAADLKWNVEGRFDYVNATVKHEFETSTSNYSETRGEFQSNVVRLNAVYTINETLSGRFRYRLSTEQAAASQNRDLSFQNVDFFYVDHKTPWFTTRIGKQNNPDSLGREYYVSGTDYNVTEYKFKTAGGQGSTAYTTSNTAVYNEVKNDADIYHVGATLLFAQVPNSTVSVTLFEPQKSTTYTDVAGSATDAKNTQFGYGVYYNGSFFDKMLQPTLGYTSLGIAGTSDASNSANNTENKSHKLISAGVRSELFGVTVDLDWKQYKRANTATAAATTNADKASSIYANVAYTWDMLTPFVSYIHDKYDRDAANSTTVGDYKRDALSAGLQIKPFKENNFRYHVTYTSDVKTVDLATSSTVDKKVSANTIAAGIKFDI